MRLGTRTLKLAGRRSGRLVALRPHHQNAALQWFWLCQCDCGRTAVVRAHRINREQTRSCGCLGRDTTSARRSADPVAPAEERFWRYVMPEPNSGCWLWTGAVARSGHGVIGLGRRADGVRTAHRLSFEMHKGPVPAGREVCHLCDVPSCVNPDHLMAGTRSDNMLHRYRGAPLNSQKRSAA